VDPLVKLKAFLDAHPNVDVNRYTNAQGVPVLHVLAIRNYSACIRLLIDMKADVEACGMKGITPLILVSVMGHSESVQVLIESKADVTYASDDRSTAIGCGASSGNVKCLSLLINAKADVNARGNHGMTPVICACQEDRWVCVQLLLDNNANLSLVDNYGDSAVYWAIRLPEEEPAHRVLGMPFSVLSCNTDTKNVRFDNDCTASMLTAHLDEYKRIHTFIDECHSVTKHALSEDIVVDTRVGRHDNGMYHEPLEQVLLYLGLSMDKNQTVNTSIDSKSGVTRALMPGHPVNANLWFELYQRTHCSSCSARPAKLKKCTCFTTRYCNSDCQRKHWLTHKPSHKAVLQMKKKNKSWK
jgi:hypothetical protein